jgi:hypothetical protein
MLTQAATETMMDHGAVILALYGTWSQLSLSISLVEERTFPPIVAHPEPCRFFLSPRSLL